MDVTWFRLDLAPVMAVVLWLALLPAFAEAKRQLKQPFNLCLEIVPEGYVVNIASRVGDVLTCTGCPKGDRVTITNGCPVGDATVTSGSIVWNGCGESFIGRGETCECQSGAECKKWM